MSDGRFNIYEFHPSRVFFDDTRKAFRNLPSQNPWESPAKRLREQWEIGNFAVGLSMLRRQSVEVRLSHEEPADGQLRIDGHLLIDVQTTVRIREERRPAWEYRYREVSLGEQKQNAIEVSPEKATQWIRKTVEAKQNKQYAKERPLWLLIYSTFASRGLDLDALVCTVRELNPSNFDKVWLLTDIIHSSDSDEFAMIPLYPAIKGEFFPYEYCATSERALGLNDIAPYPFGPMTVEARKPTVVLSKNDEICSPMFALIE